MIDFTCVILAGGKSSRMKEDKALLPFENTTLIDYQYNKLSKIFKNVYISSKTDKFKSNQTLILDENKIYSPLVALSSIFEQLADKKVFIITVDVPFIKRETIVSLIDESYNYDITIAKDSNFNHNLLGVYSRSLMNKINTNISNNIHKISLLLEDSNLNTVYFENEEEFINLNTKLEYKEAIQSLEISNK